MKYAVIKTQGKQYKVAEGDILEVEQLTAEPKKTINFGEVLLLVEDEKVLVGQPFLDGIKVTGEVLEHLKGEKIRVAKFHAKSRYRRVLGFRPKLTRVKIEKIVTGEQKVAVREEKKERKRKVKVRSKT